MLTENLSELEKFCIENNIPDCEYKTRMLDGYNNHFIGLRFARDCLLEYMKQSREFKQDLNDVSGDLDE